MYPMQHPSTFVDCDVFEKQVSKLLDDALVCNSITKQQHHDLVCRSESTWPCHQHSFIDHFNLYLKKTTSQPHVNPNVLPSSATSVATIPDDSDHVWSHSDAYGNPAETSTQLSGDIHQSLPISKANPAPTFVPAPLAAQKSTLCLTHDDTCGNSVPCRQPTPTIQAVPTDSQQPDPSASQNSVYQRNQHIRNQRSITIGSLRFELPPVADISAGTYTDVPPAVNSDVQFPPSKLAISHSSIIDPQTKKITATPVMQARLLADVQISQYLSNQNPAAESAANSNQHPTAESAANSIIAESANIKSQSLLLNPHCDNQNPAAESAANSNQHPTAESAANSIIAESANIKSQSLLLNPHCDDNSNFNFNFSYNSNSNSNSSYNSILLQLQLLSSSPLVIQILEYILTMQMLRSLTPLIEPDPPPIICTWMISIQIILKCLYGGSNSMGYMHQLIESLSDHEHCNRNYLSVVS